MVNAWVFRNFSWHTMRGFFGIIVYNDIEIFVEMEGGDIVHEEEIICLMQASDERGIEALLKHYGPLMRYIIAPILSNAQDREDCLSETAMRVWDKINLYDKRRGTWAAWLTALTRNMALNHLRQNNSAAQSEAISPDMPSSEPAPEACVLQKELQSALSSALMQLPLEERMLFYRKYYYLQSTAQIASELGMTQRAVEGRLYRTKQHLRKMMGGDTHA